MELVKPQSTQLEISCLNQQNKTKINKYYKRIGQNSWPILFIYITHARTLCRHIYTYFCKKYKKVLAHYIYMRIIVKAPQKGTLNITEKNGEKKLKKAIDINKC